MKDRGKRPFGLNVIIVMQVLTVLFTGGLLALVVIAVYLAESNGLAAGITPEDWAALGSAMNFYEISMLLFAFVVNLLCAVGLWLRRRWAWYLTMIQVGVFMLEDLQAYFTSAPPENYVWTMLLNVVMVFYLNQREVQAVFQRKEQTDPNDLMQGAA